MPQKRKINEKTSDSLQISTPIFNIDGLLAEQLNSHRIRDTFVERTRQETINRLQIAGIITPLLVNQFYYLIFHYFIIGENRIKISRNDSEWLEMGEIFLKTTCKIGRLNSTGQFTELDPIIIDEKTGELEEGSFAVTPANYLSQTMWKSVQLTMNSEFSGCTNGCTTLNFFLLIIHSADQPIGDDRNLYSTKAQLKSLLQYNNDSYYNLGSGLGYKDTPASMDETAPYMMRNRGLTKRYRR
jgi:hypothetical protein